MTYDEWVEQNKKFLIEFLKENARIDVTQVRRNTHEISISVNGEVITTDTIYI